jgi:hypothetical protein
MSRLVGWEKIADALGQVLSTLCLSNELAKVPRL